MISLSLGGETYCRSHIVVQPSRHWPAPSAVSTMIADSDHTIFLGSDPTHFYNNKIDTV